MNGIGAGGFEDYEPFARESGGRGDADHAHGQNDKCRCGKPRQPSRSVRPLQCVSRRQARVVKEAGFHKPMVERVQQSGCNCCLRAGHESAEYVAEMRHARIGEQSRQPRLTKRHEVTDYDTRAGEYAEHQWCGHTHRSQHHVHPHKQKEECGNRRPR